MNRRPAPYRGDESYALISYCYDDKDTVLPVISAFAQKGVRVWFDDGTEPDKEKQRMIDSKLDGCTVFAAFVSSRALMSHSCRRKINRAFLEHKSCLIIMLDDAELSLVTEIQFKAAQTYLAYIPEAEPCRELPELDFFAETLSPAAEKISILLLERQINGAKIITDGSLTIGWYNDCGYTLKNDTVSRRHAEFFCDGISASIKDTSRFGTYVNKKLIGKDTLVPLSPGDEITMGTEKFVLKSVSFPDSNVFFAECIRTKVFKQSPDSGVMSIGYGKDCDIIIYDNPSVSEKHLIIERKDDGIYLTDNDSLNGVFVDGVPIEPSVPYKLSSSGKVCVADEAFYISFPAESAVHSPEADNPRQSPILF